jgi:hypothetical protein
VRDHVCLLAVSIVRDRLLAVSIVRDRLLAVSIVENHLLAVLIARDHVYLLGVSTVRDHVCLSQLILPNRRSLTVLLILLIDIHDPSQLILPIDKYQL